MDEFPEKGRFEAGRADPVTGERWVYVSREMAHAHPKGRLGPALYLIILALVALSGLRFYAFTMAGSLADFGAALLLMLSALGLYLRAPVALFLVVALFAFSLMRLFVGIGALDITGLAFLFAQGAALVYLLTSERANLIYRHRYKSYPEEGGG